MSASRVFRRNRRRVAATFGFVGEGANNVYHGSSAGLRTHRGDLRATDYWAGLDTRDVRLTGPVTTASIRTPKPGLTTPEISMPPMRKLLCLDDDKLTTRLTKGLSGLYGRQGEELELKIVGANRIHGGVHLKGTIHDQDGSEVGWVDRLWHLDDDGRLIVKNLDMQLNHGQRRGFATALTKSWHEYYRKSGVDLVTVSAGGAGSEVWAKFSFGWRTNKEHVISNGDNIQGRINDLLGDCNTDTDADQLRSWRDRFDGPVKQWPTPYDLVKTELGMRVMKNLQWTGQMRP